MRRHGVCTIITYRVIFKGKLIQLHLFLGQIEVCQRGGLYQFERQTIN